MTRDDLYGHYRRYYVPNNATLVIAGDVEPDDVLRRVERALGNIPSGAAPPRLSIVEPPQLGERRVVVERPGTTAYLKIAWHAPAATEPDFFPMLVLDAVLAGAKGVNLWSSFRGVPPQRKSRLYTGLVERSLASSVSGALVPTAQPFVYTLSMTAMQGVDLPSLEAAALEQIEKIRTAGVTEEEVARARRQLRARFVFENDSVTNIAHQLGYFDTVTGPEFFGALRANVENVTAEQVFDVARRRLSATTRTVGWFKPLDPRAVDRERGGAER
jgi:zinc protease